MHDLQGRYVWREYAGKARLQRVQPGTPCDLKTSSVEEGILFSCPDTAEHEYRMYGEHPPIATQIDWLDELGVRYTLCRKTGNFVIRTVDFQRVMEAMVLPPGTLEQDG